MCEIVYVFACQNVTDTVLGVLCDYRRALCLVTSDRPSV
jgi:hypothetical protein